MIKRPSMRAAINAMCKGCIYDPAEPGNWRQQVGACQITGCPLWPLRPTSQSGQRTANSAAESSDPSKAVA
jgi:hypothetical protein